MTMQKISVFFDASILNQIGLPPDSAMLQRLVDLVQFGLISVVTTDITKAEVVRYYKNKDASKLEPMLDQHFRRLASRHLKIPIPAIERQDLENQLRDIYTERVDRMFALLDAETLYVDDVKPSAVFADYDRGEGLFTTKNKKNQFADAFIFELLKRSASAGTPLLLVAADRDFADPSESIGEITVIDSIAGLFGELGLILEEPNPRLEDFLYENLMDVDEFTYWVEQDDLEGTDGGRVVTYCEGIEIRGITAFAQTAVGAPILVSVDVQADLNVETTYITEKADAIDNDRGTARVSFYGAIVTDDSGMPIEIADVRVFNCDLSWANTSIWFIF